HGPVCPRCGSLDRITPVKGGRTGLYRCGPCKRQFTVTVGTVFESSHVKLHLWLQAVHLLCTSKKGMSSHQIHRILGVTYKTAWFMTMRLREAMADGALPPLGGEGKTVEIDETYVGGQAKNRHLGRRGGGKGRERPKAPVFALVERSGKARAVHVPEVDGRNLREIVLRHVTTGTTIYSDSNHPTRFAAHGFPGGSVNHKDGEYVRGDVHSNTVEGFFAILKRGIIGTYHHVSEEHLHRYLSEFSFRYSNRSALGVEDAERGETALRGIVGKRLTYRRTGGERPEAQTH
ncbi:MAG TPA: IS1595 family transposase, partial [Stellaceae bacterium]|nr:IS1595 family transposase [Stellaceae bacterium]